MGPAFDTFGNIHLGIRRAVFGLFGLAVVSTGATAVLTRVSSGAYSAVERTVRSFKAHNMETSLQTFGAIQPGRTYAAKQPGFAQTTRGAAVFNDRRVVEVTPTGEAAPDYSVKYVAPGNDTPQTTTGTEFLAWVGSDITDALPPAEGEGQLGDGHNWRAYSGTGAARTDIAPAAFVTGAGQLEADSNAEHPQAPQVAHKEGGEGGTPVEVKNSPATAPTPERLANATAQASEAVVAPQTAKESRTRSLDSTSDATPRQTRPRSADSSTEATASGESLKDRAKRH